MFAIDLSDLFVVLVEPSSAQARIIVNAMETMGVRHVDRFASGEEALAGMAAERPDLVVSAMHLPDLTGTELVLRMREDQALRDVAFMLISSETGYQYLEPIRQAGVVAILPKPFKPEDLRRALSATVDWITPDDDAAGGLELETLRVLLVDDSTMARRMIRRVLENLGIEQFVEAKNGKEAAELVEAQMFDLVVTDYNMPEMDGKALVEFIRHHSSQATVPVLMVTSESSEGRLSAVQQAGVSALCDKPFEPATVRQLLEQIIEAETV